MECFVSRADCCCSLSLSFDLDVSEGGEERDVLLPFSLNTLANVVRFLRASADVLVLMA